MNADQLAADSGNGGGAQIRKEIESISTEIRHICEDLSPSVLANVGLFAALEWALADSVAHLPREGRFEYEFVAPDEMEERLALDQSTRIQIYRIVQEAISNVCRHAGCRRARLVVEVRAGLDVPVEVQAAGTQPGHSAMLESEPRTSLAADDGILVIFLEDDGKGMDQSPKKNHSGRGLSNIISRASLIEAEAAWKLRPGGGTTFTLRKRVHLKPH